MQRPSSRDVACRLKINTLAFWRKKTHQLQDTMILQKQSNGKFLPPIAQSFSTSMSVACATELWRPLPERMTLPSYRFLPDGPSVLACRGAVLRAKLRFHSQSIEAGCALHADTEKRVNLPLPLGPKARLIQIHLDAQAKLPDKPVIELVGSMTSFIKQAQGTAPNGPEMRKSKDQAATIDGALFRFATIEKSLDEVERIAI